MFYKKNKKDTLNTILAFAVWIFSMMPISCYKSPPPPPPSPPFVSPETMYPVGPGDSIEVKLVPDDIGISGTYEIDDEGRIIVPLLGELYVTGMTSVGLRKFFEKLLSEYIKKPSVSVYIRKMKSQKLFVWTPDRIGVIFMQRPLNILEAVTMSGVRPKDDKISRIYIIRWNGKKKKSDIYSVNVEKIIREGDFTQNVYLKPGDIVFIPPKYIRSVREIIGIYSGIGYSLLFGLSGF